MNPYEILEVDKDTSLEDIKLKYKQLANKHHPDKGGDSEKFILINLAYEILTDPIKRQSFDDFGNFFTDSSIIDESKQKLHDLFYEFINPHNPDNQDLIMTMSFELDRQHQRIKKRIEQINFSIEKLTKVKNKLKLKKKTENYMEDLVTTSITQCKLDLDTAIREDKVFAYTKLILNNYSYSDFDYYEKLPK